MTYPDMSDIPRRAARPLRYLERYVITTQGEVFWMTEILAQLEGLKKSYMKNVIKKLSENKGSVNTTKW